MHAVPGILLPEGKVTKSSASCTKAVVELKRTPVRPTALEKTEPCMTSWLALANRGLEDDDIALIQQQDQGGSQISRGLHRAGKHTHRQAHSLKETPPPQPSQQAM